MVLTEESAPTATLVEWYVMCAWCGKEFQAQAEEPLIQNHGCTSGGLCGGSGTPGCRVEPCADRASA